MKITKCRVNHLINPIGYQFDKTVFTFVVSGAVGKKQVAAQIMVAADEQMKNVVYDSGMSDRVDSLGTEVKLTLKPRTRYYWTAKALSDVGEEAVSEVSYFETAKMDEAWSGKLISCDRSESRHPVFTRTFDTDKTVKAARLYITGLGLYQVKVNSQAVSGEKLTPYYTDYNKWVQYQTYDVTDMISKQNELEITLGNGWYSGRFNFMSKTDDKGYYGDDWKLIAELHILYEDGSFDVINTDESWILNRSNITFSNIYDGEQRDDTLPELSPESVIVLNETLPLKERMSIPVCVHEELPAKELLHTPSGEWVFDIGQNMTGGFRLRVNEPYGAVIHIQFGEVLQNGNFYRDNLRTAKAEYIYVSDGKELVIEPMFTFYGYQYAKVEGCNSLNVGDFAALAYYSDITPVGELVTGDEKLNKLISNITWGQKSNFVDIPTDCPQRDERMGWTADTQVFMATANYFTDSCAFYRRYLYELRIAQGENGCVPDVAPRTGVDGGSSVWGDAATIIPWKLYEFYGDKSILAESYKSMKAWVDYIAAVDGEEHDWEKVFQYGDWLALDHPALKEDTTAGGTEEGFIADVYYLNSCGIVRKSAEILGYTDDVKKYGNMEKRLKAYISDEFFTKNGRLALSTQTAYTLALYYRLSENPDKLKRLFMKLLKDSEYKLKTGFVGTPLISNVLSMTGEDQVAYKLIHSEEYPGWLYEVNLGATTIWERWNSLGTDGTVSSTGMNSFNHYAYGAIGEWMWRTIGGITPDEKEPGFRQAHLRPIPDYKTGNAKCIFDSPAGTYKVSWKIIGIDQVKVEISVPFNCTVRLYLPYCADLPKEQKLETGEYAFTYRTEEPLKRTYTVDDTLEALLGDDDTKNKLMTLLPGILQAPAGMRGMTLKDLILRYQPDGADMPDMINKQLALG
jgi:alpha-L-rhamnosidase